MTEFRDPMPHEIAMADQTKAIFDETVRLLVSLHAEMVAAIEAKDVRRMRQVMGQINDALNSMDEDLDGDFVMYLISLIGNASAWTAKVQQLAEAVVKAAAWMLPSWHPAQQLIFQDPEVMRQFPDLVKLFDEVQSQRPEGSFPDESFRDDGETYRTGTGQLLRNVHAAKSCVGRFCVIHRPCKGPWDTWPTRWCGDEPGDIWRGFERICPCGVGHPAVEMHWTAANIPAHGCCGRCPCGPAACDEITDDDGNLLGYRAK